MIILALFLFPNTFDKKSRDPKVRGNVYSVLDPSCRNLGDILQQDRNVLAGLDFCHDIFWNRPLASKVAFEASAPFFVLPNDRR